MNRLSEESSPYLLLHAHNPVDWYSWSEAAFELARSEDRPIFLSVGYSTCYWCHVMERESFSDPQVAAMMNRDFVNIKVDREERPDIDEIYMTATQILTQRGGWPNSVFLTSELKPFFAGTYFPPEDRHGLPSFSTVIQSLSSAWIDRRSEVDEQAESIAAAMERALELSQITGEMVSAENLLERSLQDLQSRFDASWGGFGDAPKFPNPANLYLLGETAATHTDGLQMLEKTLDAMARGGIHDQLAGGFHRYSTDRQWLVPHFEKMLYDNGLLLGIYARYWEGSNDPEVERVVRRTIRFLQTEMLGPEGGFWSAIDAETDGHEGAYYVWTEEELRRVLGDEDFEFLAPILGFAGPPNFEGKYYIVHLPGSLGDQAVRRRMSFGELVEQVESGLVRLLETRSKRDRPATDDKILCDWNGMAISGLAEAGRIFGVQEWVEQSSTAAQFILSELRSGATLMHSWRQGKVGPQAFLSDYVFLVRGLLSLARAQPDGGWLQAASDLTDEQSDRLADSSGGFFVAAESDDVLFRSKEVMDGAVPGANAVGLLNLVDLYSETGDQKWLDRADQTLRAFSGLADRHPAAFKTFTVAANRFVEAGGDSEQTQEDHPAIAESEHDTVVTADVQLGAAMTDRWRPFQVRIEVESGWHVYAPEAADSGLQVVRLGGQGVDLRSVIFPPGNPELLVDGGEPVSVYSGSIEVAGELRSDENLPSSLRVEYQACELGRCLTPAAIDLPIPD